MNDFRNKFYCSLDIVSIEQNFYKRIKDPDPGGPGGGGGKKSSQFRIYVLNPVQSSDIYL